MSEEIEAITEFFVSASTRTKNMTTCTAARIGRSSGDDCIGGELKSREAIEPKIDSAGQKIT